MLENIRIKYATTLR